MSTGPYILVEPFLTVELFGMTTAGGLITDRYGVPQYSGEAELFEEYEERAWDLF